MRRIVPVVAVVVVIAGIASPAAARGFRYGVTAGEMTGTSAIVWTRADRAGRVTLRLSRDPRFRRGVRSYRLRSLAARDRTVQRRVRGLRPGRRYYYRFSQGSRRDSSRGTFVTAPRRSSSAPVEFALSGDTDFTRRPGSSRPYWNGGGILRRMARERNAFNIHFGDTIYSDTEVPFPGGQPPPALSRAAKWGKYRTNLSNRYLRGLRSSGGLYSHWDDHEFINDFSRRETVFDPSGPGPRVTVDPVAVYRDGVRAFRDYSPVTYSAARGIYRSFRWGRNLELFFLDQRSFRDAKVTATDVCDNPQTGGPDFAPNAPQRIRSAFAAVSPSLAQPVSQACKDALRDPNRDFLGADQFTRFTSAIRNSKARWKVIMNEMPIQQYYLDPYDNWEGYGAERARLLTFLRDNAKNTIFLTTDVHATFINDARLTTFPEEGGTQNSGIFDVAVGPVATASFAREIDDAVNRPGSGAIASSAFLTQPPPNGPGMRCSVVDQFSYGQVRATRATLTVTSKGANGLPLCEPVRLRLR